MTSRRTLRPGLDSRPRRQGIPRAVALTSRSATRQSVEDQFGGYLRQREAINGPMVQRQRDEILFALERDRASVAGAELGAGLDGRPRAV